MTFRGGLAVTALLVGSAAAGCSSAPKTSCTQNSCQPTITLQYRTPINDAYMIQISVNRVTYQSNCPMGPAGGPQGSGSIDAAVAEITCDASGAVLTGVDLGHGENQTLDLVVQLTTGGDVTSQFMVTANLSSIANDKDCALVCFQHNATVSN
jgi:hypothetical protein